KRFGDREVLRGLTLHVDRNEIMAVVGPSGCGKTTMLNIIAGLYPPDDGEVFIDRVLVDGRVGRRRVHVMPARRKVGYVFQSYALFPHMRVERNVSYGLKEMRLSKHEIRRQTRSLLEFVGLQDRSDSLPRMLSGGEQQRVALMRSAATNPEVLLLDEPLAALDPRIRDSLRTDLKNRLKTLGVTCIYVTHDLAEAYVISDRMAVMGNGRIEQIGRSDDVLDEPNSRFVAEFLGLNVYEGRISRDAADLVRVRIGAIEILADSVEGVDGDGVLVTLKPEDVVLSCGPAVGNEGWRGRACNSLPGTVAEIVRMKSSAKVVVDVGFPVKSELNLSRLKDLDLTEGKRVYVHFKAESLNISRLL
ncbi:ABC transporter ATP-binding protein, partial [Candidatus Bathyarchaeota archaeon]|nr:ABC transporter ATP-binding protein [Candidatus Bathyarchaeota archaeon]